MSKVKNRLNFIRNLLRIVLWLRFFRAALGDDAPPGFSAWSMTMFSINMIHLFKIRRWKRRESTAGLAQASR